MKMLASFLIADCVEQLPATRPSSLLLKDGSQARHAEQVRCRHIGHPPGEIDRTRVSFIGIVTVATEHTHYATGKWLQVWSKDLDRAQMLPWYRRSHVERG